MRLSPFFFSIIIAANVIGSVSGAQVDPSSALLLNSSGDTTVRETGIGSGRYTVRPKADAKRDTSRNVRSENAAPVVQPSPSATPTPIPAPPESPKAAQTVPQKAPQPAPQAVPQKISAPQAQSPQTPAQQPGQYAPQAQQAAPQQTQVQDGRENRSDSRLTLIELSIAPGYLYNSSESSYSFRNYNVSAPTIGADARVWINPSVAIQTGYLGTLSASVSDSSNGSRSVAAAQQWFTLGVRSRSFLSASRLVPTLSTSFDYFEYEFRAPSDALTRAKLKTMGIRISADAELPVTPYRSWTLGFSIAPKMQHREGSTAVNFQSGGNVDANQVGASIGSIFKFDVKSSMFIKLSHVVEKDLFTGPATVADPVSGQTPTGVSVTNSFTMIQLGYTWGN
ncbi:MAG: hypothetical protein V4692_05900 [Bdellovibrionota bacterium]